MSSSDFDRFIQEVSQNKNLQELLASEGANPVEIANQHGFEITLSPLMRFQAESTLELSDDELETAAGGVTPFLTSPFYTATPALIGGAAAGVVGGAVAGATVSVCN